MTSLRPQVSVIIPAYGPAAPVVEAVDRLLAISELHLEVIVVNNDPGNGLVDLLPPRPRLRVEDVGWNSGFTGAINLGCERARGEYILFHNTDLQVGITYIGPLFEFMGTHPDAGCASGLLFRSAPGEPTFSSVIDSAGIVVRRDRGAHDRGEGFAPGDFRSPEEVFAVSGAALLLRRTALDDVSPDGPALDPSFFMYKDDLDLAWRLRLRGWECWVVPEAVGYHVRAGRGLGGRGYLRGALRYFSNERRKPDYIRVHSLKNEWLLLLKYESFRTLLPDLPFIVVRQAALLLVTSLVSPRRLVRALKLFAAAAPAACAARRHIAEHRTVSPASIRRRWFVR
ncbi:MAG: glycosyltransferase [Dehalococcoidia bacterium]